MRTTLKAIRDILLPLHKLLLDRERGEYEKVNGPIGSPGAFLQLLIGDEQFAWLRQLSGMIVQIDEILAPRSKAGPAEEEAAVQEVRILLAKSGDSEFQQKYWAAVEDDPDVVIAQCKLERLLGPLIGN